LRWLEPDCRNLTGVAPEPIFVPAEHFGARFGGGEGLRFSAAKPLPVSDP
jgi:hypothetical protein